MTRKTLLVVSHSRTGATARMLDAVLRGARDPEVGGVDVVVRDAFAAGPEDVLAAQGIVLGTPERFGYMSGAMKDFLERIYHPCLDHTQGLPCALFVRAGNDGRGAIASMERILTGLRWRQVLPPVLLVGEGDEARLADCVQLGQTFAAGLEAGIF